MSIADSMRMREMTAEQAAEFIANCERQAIIRRQVAAGEHDGSLRAYHIGVAVGFNLAANWVRTLMTEWERQRERVGIDEIHEQRLLDGVLEGFQAALGLSSDKEGLDVGSDKEAG